MHELMERSETNASRFAENNGKRKKQKKRGIIYDN